MSTILYIKANSKPDGLSRTFRVSDEFIKEYQEKHPEDKIITLDLYKEEIKALSTKDINELFAPKNNDSRNNPILKYSYQFLDADKYVIADPMWNLSIPAILKEYIDYVCVSGITFKYTENGPVGLCKNKKAIHITTRGGVYSAPPGSDYEMGERYLRTIFAFFGIVDFTSVAAEGLDIIGNDVEALVQKAIQDAKEKAGNF